MGCISVPVYNCDVTTLISITHVSGIQPVLPLLQNFYHSVLKNPWTVAHQHITYDAISVNDERGRKSFDIRVRFS